MSQPICALSRAEIEQWFLDRGEPRYRAEQLLGWIRRGAGGFDEMLDLPGTVRSDLAREFRVTTLAATPLRPC